MGRGLGLVVGAVVAGCSLPDPDWPTPPPRVQRFDVTPVEVSPGGQTTVAWRIEGATDVRLVVGGASEGVGFEGSKSLTPSATLPLAIEAVGPGGTARARAEARVGRPVTVAIDQFTVTPTQARALDPVRVAWRTTGASAARLRLVAPDSVVDVAGGLPAEGARYVRLVQSALVELEAEGLGGPLQRQVEVRIAESPPEVVRFLADPPEVLVGQTTRLVWAVQGADRCEIYEGNARQPLLDSPSRLGTVPVQPPPGLVEYRLVATGPGGVREATTQVSARAPRPPEIQRFTATPTVTGVGGEIRLTWRVERSEQVTLQVSGGASPGPSPSRSVPPEGQRLVLTGRQPLSASLLAFGGGFTVSAAAMAEVDFNRPELLELAVTPSPSAPGEPVVLSWRALGADRVSILLEAGPTLGASLPPEGQLPFSPEVPTRIEVVAENQAGRTARSLRVDVSPRPRIERFEALDPLVRVGRPYRVGWRVLDSETQLLLEPGREAIPLPPEGTRWVRRATASNETRLQAENGPFAASATASVPTLPAATGRQEVEPNDDPATAHALAALPASWSGTLSPGDRDLLALDLGSDRLVVQNACPGPDIALEVRAADDEGAPAAWARGLSLEGCGRIEAEIADLPPGLLLGLTGAGGYELGFSRSRPSCGDGIIDRQEACDDGNRAGGDGCDSNCQVEGTSEQEPNDDRARADEISPGTIDAFLHHGDVDVFSFVVSDEQAGRWVFALESMDGGCVLDARLALFDAIGLLASAGEDGLGCPALLGPSTVLEPGRHFLEVRPGHGQTHPARGRYRLRVGAP